MEPIHVLHYGRALCPIAGIPRDWPLGHRWVTLACWQDATCTECRSAAQARMPEAPIGAG